MSLDDTYSIKYSFTLQEHEYQRIYIQKSLEYIQLVFIFCHTTLLMLLIHRNRVYIALKNPLSKARRNDHSARSECYLLEWQLVEKVKVIVLDLDLIERVIEAIRSYRSLVLLYSVVIDYKSRS